MPNKYDYCKQICDAAKKMAAMHLVDGTAGNISVRIPNSDLVAITPTTVPYDEYTPELMCIVDLDGNLIEGTIPPSSETPMHTMLHKQVGKPIAVIHTHSPYATTFACLGEPVCALGQEGLGFGQAIVPCTSRYGLPGTYLLGAEVLRIFDEYPNTHAMLLRNHGNLVFSDTVGSTLELAEYVEFSARMYFQARCIGKPICLSDEQINEINENYKRMKATTRA